MKTKFLFFTCLLLTLQAFSQIQKNIAVAQQHFSNLNVEPISIGAANDVIVASNLFDPTMSNPKLTLKRVDDTGAIIWIKSYDNTTIGTSRLFDITTYLDLIIVVGSMDVAGIQRAFIARIDGLNGNFMDAKFLDIVSPNFHSTPLKVITTLSDANGDTVPDPGFVITGLFGSCVPIDVNCGLNIGFVVRTDLSFTILWSIELESIVTSTLDYDFINGVTETSDGFLLTGSVTGEFSPGIFQQGVLAHKIDFQGIFQWDNSYLFGNSRDVSVDAYFDSGTNEIFMLNNYSQSHHFGVTVLNNATGAIVPAKSWWASSPFLDYYGFKIMESAASANNLIIAGYTRENIIGSTTDQSNPFLHEFDKATGNQVGMSYQYLLPYTEPTPEVFNLWNSQLPLIYYPDMAMFYVDISGTAHYAFVGYRTDTFGYSNAELIATPMDKRNQCNRLNLTFSINPLAVIPITTVSSVGTPSNATAFVLNDAFVTFTEASCDPTLSVGSNTINEFILYPNPASNKMFISGNDIKSVQIVDALGRVVLASTSYSAATGIYVENFKNGLYFVTVKGENNTIQTFKLVKK
ncbi:MAG: hypothetical protein COZ75_02270 [Flavobacteriaceae bacterium CG_4_8_14_3_um_filter_34_10]|nr:MAG: hypothetical protein COZ75_02270 [Flavobacteriaceae bacterium CG_4_8_14_3_um_filter_34_10]